MTEPLNPEFTEFYFESLADAVAAERAFPVNAIRRRPSWSTGSD